MKSLATALGAGVSIALWAFPLSAAERAESFDVVIVGGTPGGIMAALSAARNGHTAVLLERTAHLGGLPANGLGATDIATRGATAGLFAEFVSRVRRHYVQTYGQESPQVKDASDGYHFEPRVAEMVFDAMLAEHKDRVSVRRLRQFDAEPENVVLEGGRLREIRVTDRQARQVDRYLGKVFIDATYEGDLAAAAGVPFRLGREAADEFREPMAGRLYKTWGVREPEPGSTGQADNAVQSYNYRLCRTQSPENKVPIPKPDRYDRHEYVSLADDVKQNRFPGLPERRELDWQGIGRVVNMVLLPNGKPDANNQHAAFLSTDLPEVNWPWPTSSWDWRDAYARRLRDYTLGLLWFVQHDPALPEEFRERCLRWGLAKDEYADNGHFPRQVYVREGRRIQGEYLWTAHDAIPVQGNSRPPVHAASVTASHYALDSHAVRKREPGRAHLDGFFSYPTKPYTVPYGVILPKRVEGLLVPVAVSGTHIGFSTLRMEPCWMALGQAAGTAACLAIDEGRTPRAVSVLKLQERLLEQGAVLIYFKDARPDHPNFRALQFFALRGFYAPSAWEARLDRPVPEEMANKWIAWAGAGRPEDYVPGKPPHGRLLQSLYDRLAGQGPQKADAVRAAW